MADFYEESLGKTRTHVFLLKWRNKINQLVRSTHFTKSELEKLFLIHYKITKDCGALNYVIFRQFCHASLGITDPTHYEKIFQIFDSENRGNISPVAWARNLSILLKGNLEEKIEFVWQVYSQKGEVTRDIITSNMKKAIVKRGDAGYDYMMKELVSLLQKKLDKDNDGKISFQDFQQSLIEEPLLLECLGQCLPTQQAASTFLTTITGKLSTVRILPNLH